MQSFCKFYAKTLHHVLFDEKRIYSLLKISNTLDLVQKDVVHFVREQMVRYQSKQG